MDLKKGSFYWVRMVIGDERSATLPETVWAPARYTGKSADTHAREETRGDMIVVVAYSPDTWDFVGFRSEDGHHFVDVMEVGEEIVRTEPEADATYRIRLLEVIESMNDLDRYAIVRCSGEGLDEIGRHVGIERR